MYTGSLCQYCRVSMSIMVMRPLKAAPVSTLVTPLKDNGLSVPNRVVGVCPI